MNSFWTVLSHTYFSKVKTKQFIITTLITLAIILLMANIPKIIDFFQSRSESGDVVAIIDETNQLSAPYQEILKTIDPELEIITGENDEKVLDEKVLDGEIDGYLVLQTDENNLPIAVYKTESLTNMSIPSVLEQALQQLKTSVAAAQFNLSGEQLMLINTPVEMEQIAIGDNAKSEEELSQARGLIYVLLFFIYFAVIMYANMIAMEVATEKASRVMEILISSVPPVTQMFAKIIGVALVGLTQMIIWLAAGYLAIKQNLDGMTEGFFSVFGFGGTNVTTIVYAIVFFLLGFFLYAMMAAFLGSLVSRIEDVGQAINPMTWLIIIGFILAMSGLATPDAAYVTITSYIPFFTPMIMFMRVGLLDLPFWEPLIGITLMIATIIILAIFGARVYRGGVLMYGSTSPLKSIKNALQLSKNN